MQAAPLPHLAVAMGLPVLACVEDFKALPGDSLYIGSGNASLRLLRAALASDDVAGTDGIADHCILLYAGRAVSAEGSKCSGGAEEMPVVKAASRPRSSRRS